MGISVDSQHYTALFCPAGVNVLQIQSVWISVYFQGCVVLGCGVNKRIYVHLIWLSFGQKPSRRMTDDMDKPVFNGRDDPLGHCGFVHIETAVDARDNHVKLFQNLIRVIEAAVLEYVNFASREDLDP